MPVASTWNERELPILEAVCAAEERGERPGSRDLAVATGLEQDIVTRTVGPLVDGRYLAGTNVTTKEDRFPRYMNLRLLERGRRAIGLWPPGPGDAFVVALDRLIAVETDADQRSRLVGLRAAAGDVGRQILAGAVVAAGQAALS